MSAEQIKNLNNRISTLEKDVRKLKSVRTLANQFDAADNTFMRQRAGAPSEVLPVPLLPADSNKRKDRSTGPAPRGKLGRRIWRQTKRIFFKRDRLERIGIVFGIAYAVITGLLWWDQHQNFKADERAWVGIKEVTLSGGVKNPLTVAVNVINSGKTPALQVHLGEVRAGNTETNWIVSGSSKENNPITPGTNTVFYVDVAIDELMVKGLTEHTAKVFVKGNVMYRDIFGNIGQTDFCTYYPSPVNVTNFFNCPNGGSDMK